MAGLRDNTVEVRLLNQVARSFALTIRVLPRLMQRPVGVAYLLARAADSIADLNFLPASERLTLLDRLEQAVDGQEDFSAELPSLLAALPDQAQPELQLVSRLPALIYELRLLDQTTRREVQRLLRVIISGQRLDLQRFEVPGKGSLQSAEELLDYTYKVAGCVGEFWSRLSNQLLLHKDQSFVDELCRRGRNYGQALQLVNILRDLPLDLRRGRCYLPADQLQRSGTDANNLFSGRGWNNARQVFEEWWQQAWQWLHDGWRYVLLLPFGQIRLRLATSWPALLGVRTLRLVQVAAKGDYLASRRPAKVTRKELRALIARSALCVFVPRLWEGLWNRVART